MAIHAGEWLLCWVLITAAASGSDSDRGRDDGMSEADRVLHLPGEPPGVKFRQYAGYVKLGAGSHKALFYWFFEAQEQASKKPLVLWLNGGPGCSSIAYGAALELGPFLIRTNRTNLTLNKYSWNRAANILFLEAPVGVGFSYTNRSADLEELGDAVTARDSHAFLLHWFDRFPHFKSHEFYLAGESYAGHFVPQLADAIQEGNRKAPISSFINLKGFLIGNAALNDPTDSFGEVEFAWSRAMISDELHGDLLKECRFRGNETPRCDELYDDFYQATAGIDISNIYGPVCLADQSSPPRGLPFKQGIWDKVAAGYDPCVEYYVGNYFNREDVQRALHANVTKLPYEYSPCSVAIRRWNDSAETVLPLLQKLLHAGLRIWVYSGDTDGRVPVTSTRYSINQMGMRVKEKWRAWFDGKQVGGWTVSYGGGLTLATVRGAGHEVPMYAPRASLTMLSSFLSFLPLPKAPF